MNDTECKQKRLVETSKEIEALTKELQSLILAGVFDNSTTIDIGDKITIKDNYRGLKGRAGTVIAVTKARFKVRLDDGTYIYKAKDNVIKHK